MLSHGLNQLLSTWGEGRAKPGELRCMHCRPQLRVDRGGEGVLLDILAYLRLSEGKQLFSFISVPTAVAFEQVLTFCSLAPCCSAVTALLSIIISAAGFLFHTAFDRCAALFPVRHLKCSIFLKVGGLNSPWLNLL